MTRAQELAKSLRQIVTLFWVLGVLATLGYVMAMIYATSAVVPGSITGPLVLMVATWIGLGWMGLMANAAAELLAPSAQPVEHASR